MRDNHERIQCVLQRAAALQERDQKRRTRKNESFFITVSVMLSCLLVYCIGTFPAARQTAAVAGHCGAILLIGGIGGYVLTAIITFIVATALTVICIKRRNK